jgi:hypothetical protein
MTDDSFWEIANSSAVNDGFHDVAYQATESEFVARAEACGVLYAEARLDGPSACRLVFPAPLNDNVVSLDAFRARRKWLVA